MPPQAQAGEASVTACCMTLPTSESAAEYCMLMQGSSQPVSAAAFASSHPPGNGNGDAAGPSLGRGHRSCVGNMQRF